MKNLAAIQNMSEDQMIDFLKNCPEEQIRNDFCANVCSLRRKHNLPACDDTGCTQTDEDIFRRWLRSESKLLTVKKGV